MTDDAARAAAVADLEQIIATDSLYKPARFFLGYARLLRGDAEQARAIFDALTAPVEAEAERRFRGIQERWVKTGLKLGAGVLVKHIEPVRRVMLPWITLWQDISTFLLGGTLVRMSEQWATFERHFESWSKRTPPRAHVEDLLMTLYIDTFRDSNLTFVRDWVLIAAGKSAGDITPEEARRRLDRLLDPDAIRAFDHKLAMLEIQQSSLSSSNFLNSLMDDLGLPPETPSTAEEKPAIAELIGQGSVGTLLTPGLEKLQQLWNSRDWDGCAERIKALRGWTRSPSDFEAGLALRALKLPKRWAWLIRFIMPAYALLDPWRAVHRYAFYLESRYYSALAQYSTFQPDALDSARTRAFELHDIFLLPPLPTDMDPLRHAELRLLCKCLEANAAVRLALGGSPTDNTASIVAGVRVKEIAKTLPAELIAARRSGDPDVRAAALNTSGLLERYEYGEEGRHEKQPGAGLGSFTASLDVQISADTCFYIAESLLEREEKAEAARYVEGALRLCPRHAGALHLRATTAGL